MKYRIEFCDDLMMVQDENNLGYDAHVVKPGRDGVFAAKCQIDEWKREWPSIDTVKAKREVNRLVAAM